MFPVFYGFLLNSDGLCLIVKRVLFLVFCLCMVVLGSVCVSSYDKGHLLDPRHVEAYPDLFQLRVPVSRFVDGRNVMAHALGDSSVDVISSGEGMSSSEEITDVQKKPVERLNFCEVARPSDSLEEDSHYFDMD